MIVVVDYGVGNLLSVSNMLRKAGGDAIISNDPKDVLAADKLLLPGVGSFDYAMKMLNASGLREALDDFALQYKRPVLGICLGAQIMGNDSEEGEAAGLGWIDMKCHKLPRTADYRVPHMGWNQIDVRKECPVLSKLENDARFYFVHSYHMKCIDSNDQLATAFHGVEFTCAFQRDNLIGVQFHPEKSLRHGLQLMRSFVEYTES